MYIIFTGSSNGLVLYLKHADIINAKLITELDVVVTNLLSYASTLPQNVSQKPFTCHYNDVPCKKIVKRKLGILNFHVLPTGFDYTEWTH